MHFSQTTKPAPPPPPPSKLCTPPSSLEGWVEWSRGGGHSINQKKKKKEKKRKRREENVTLPCGFLLLSLIRCPHIQPSQGEKKGSAATTTHRSARGGVHVAPIQLRRRGGQHLMLRAQLLLQSNPLKWKRSGAENVFLLFLQLLILLLRGMYSTCWTVLYDMHGSLENFGKVSEEGRIN